MTPDSSACKRASSYIEIDVKAALAPLPCRLCGLTHLFQVIQVIMTGGGCSSGGRESHLLIRRLVVQILAAVVCMSQYLWAGY